MKGKVSRKRVLAVLDIEGIPSEIRMEKYPVGLVKCFIFSKQGHELLKR